jgi:hypothetical protein
MCHATTKKSRIGKAELHRTTYEEEKTQIIGDNKAWSDHVPKKERTLICQQFYGVSMQGFGLYCLCSYPTRKYSVQWI